MGDAARIPGVRIEQSGQDGGGVLLWIKAVPGASRDQVAGALGDRLKVRVSAPPEGGKANAAICAVIAKALGVKPRQVTIESGHASAEKVVRIKVGKSGLAAADLLAMLGADDRTNT